MTDDEKRLALMTGSCPECGHGILSHRVGLCAVCGCTHIQPPNSQGRQLMLHPEQKKFMEDNDLVLWPGMGGRRP